MAPAAAETLTDYFNDTGTKPSDYDLILTGDLGEVGSKLLYELLEMNDIHIKDSYFKAQTGYTESYAENIVLENVVIE